MHLRCLVLVASLPLLSACGDSVTETEDNCNTVALPLSGSAAGPTVTNVTLEVQPGGIVVLATATDPGGTANLLDVTQSIGVFPDLQCDGAAIVLTDDLAGSGVEESFGTAVDIAVNPTLYNAIAGSARWPVVVDVRDADGNRTTGRVMATVVD